MGDRKWALGFVMAGVFESGEVSFRRQVRVSGYGKYGIELVLGIWDFENKKTNINL